MQPVASDQTRTRPPEIDDYGAPSERARALMDLDPESPEFSGALVSLLEEHLSLLKRAREHVVRRLEERYPDNGHDLWEWRKVLDTYPLPRLLLFLRSQSPRAVRLRQSSPFPDVLSDGERERLGELAGRPH